MPNGHLANHPLRIVQRTNANERKPASESQRAKEDGVVRQATARMARVKKQDKATYSEMGVRQQSSYLGVGSQEPVQQDCGPKLGHQGCVLDKFS